MIKKILNWIERRKPPYQAEWVEDLPEELHPRTVYVIGGREYPFYAAVVCPRGQCNEVVHLEISEQFAKRWTISEHPDRTISLFPSVHVTGLKCRCHYWLQRGSIIWSETPPIFVPKQNKKK